MELFLIFFKNKKIKNFLKVMQVKYNKNILRKLALRVKN